MTRNLQSVIIILFLFSISIQGQGLVINEFMASNENNITDLDGDYSDWIELYNNSDLAINLSNYGLSDDEDDLGRWKFPNYTIEPGAFLVVFASKKDFIIEDEFHTNFKISDDGEALFLTNNINHIIDQTNAVELEEDEVYLRTMDGEPNWAKSFIATPGSSNILGNVLLFAYGAGFYIEPVEEKIESSYGDTIFYTLDGSLPTTNSAVYEESIPLSYRYDEENVFSNFETSAAQSELSYPAWNMLNHKNEKSNILRCASFRNGVQTSKTYTKTYFIDSTIDGRFDMPIISLITSQENLFGEDLGILVPGNSFDAENPEWSGNFFNKGIEWERPVHIEYFKEDGELMFTQDAGIRVHGGKTRQAAQKSMRLYARRAYGKKYFDHQLLPQKLNTKYKRFILRSTMGSWGDNTIIKDELAHEIARGLDVEIQDYEPVVVFVNGAYWGIHSLRDRVDEHFISYTHGIDSDSIEIGRWGNGHYIKFENFIRANDLSIQENYEFVEQQIDISNLIDYSIMELFLANMDWPANNIELWRPTTETGKWRWILFDIDAGLTDHEINMLERVTAIKGEEPVPSLDFSTLIWRRLFENEVFVNRFLDRYQELLETWFTHDKNLERINNIKKLYIKELDNHIARWNYPLSVHKWEEEIEEKLFFYLENRPCVVEQNLKSFFEAYSFDYSCEIVINVLPYLSIYPNPSKDIINIVNNGINIQLGEISIIDNLGRTVFTQNVNEFNGKEEISLNLNHLTSGIYYLIFKDQKRIANKKFLLIH